MDKLEEDVKRAAILVFQKTLNVWTYCLKFHDKKEALLALL